MATINYNGMELEEFTSDKPVFFDKPVGALCWNNNGWQVGICEYVIAFIPRSDSCLAVTDHTTWLHMALLPDHPKPRRVTNRELSRWLAQGNGEWKLEGPVSEEDQCSSDYAYFEKYEHYKLDCDILVRKWEDTEWHEPTVEYLGIEP